MISRAIYISYSSSPLLRNDHHVANSGASSTRCYYVAVTRDRCLLFVNDRLGHVGQPCILWPFR